MRLASYTINCVVMKYAITRLRSCLPSVLPGETVAYAGAYNHTLHGDRFILTEFEHPRVKYEA